MILPFVTQRSSHLLKIIGDVQSYFFFLPYKVNDKGGKKISV